MKLRIQVLLGTPLPTFAVIPRIGYSSMLAGFALINFLCGLSVFLLSRSRGKDIPETLALPMSASSKALPLLLISTESDRVARA